MRLNKYIAESTDLSRRAADAVIRTGRVTANGKIASIGTQVAPSDDIRLDGVKIVPRELHTTILLYKPVGFVCSRNGQGSPTVYDLLPAGWHHLKPVGRLDKNSSGLLLMTDDGTLAQTLTHPTYEKLKVYEVTLNRPLLPLHRQIISDHGVTLPDGNSRFALERLQDVDDTGWRVTMHEGRNRQIRRTFAALGYDVSSLHRTRFGPYELGTLSSGEYTTINS